MNREGEARELLGRVRTKGFAVEAHGNALHKAEQELESAKEAMVAWMRKGNFKSIVVDNWLIELQPRGMGSSELSRLCMRELDSLEDGNGTEA